MKNILSSIRPPAPGDKAFFVCKKCGHRFMEVVPVLPFPVKCPECGKLTTERDRRISY